MTQDGTVIYNQFLMDRFSISQEDLAYSVEKSINEINRRMITYRGKDEPPTLLDRDVILVDDGIATGATIIAALKSIHGAGCKSITLAVPVAAPDAIESLEKEVDQLVYLRSEEPFYAVGQFYNNFEQVDDDQVLLLLKRDRLSPISKG
ncbi:hypothetical protein N752_24260 [Desulforamulus aquiferis]|nr:phosphoribosyltransferase family protein [Desulforamulus aquiferis]RYD02447.1 hypothetical protein N752_24260 [Desulforamulus aquiferis]